MIGKQGFSMAVACSAAICAGAMGATRPFDADNGKDAPPLIASDWVGAPVSLEAVRGNMVVLAFWNADIPC